jgi:hypothetical protein
VELFVCCTTARLGAEGFQVLPPNLERNDIVCVRQRWTSLGNLGKKSETAKKSNITHKFVVRNIVGRSEGLGIYLSDTSPPSNPVNCLGQILMRLVYH